MLFYSENDISEDLKCPYCKNTFKDPRVVECGRSFCMPCIEILIKEDENGFKCPVCEDFHEIPSKGYLKNFGLDQIIQAIKGNTLIKSLKSQFDIIQAKLNSTLHSEPIENKFIADLKKLNAIFNSSKEEKYKTGLNEHRELMLEQLRAQRDHELNQVNELKASPELNLQLLTNLSKSLKSTHLVFDKSKQSALESILHRTRFEKIFGLAKKAKYSHLNTNENIQYPDHMYTQDGRVFNIIMKNDHIIKLTSHLSVLQSMEKIHVPKEHYCDIFLLVNHQTKKILKIVKFDRYEFNQHSFKANSTHVIIFNTLASMIHVYDFNLDLVHSFSPQGLLDDVFVNGYEIGFYAAADFKFMCNNYKSSKIREKETKILNSYFFLSNMNDGTNINVEKYKHVRMLDFNEKFLYLERNNAEAECSLLVFNRSDGSLHFKFEKYSYNETSLHRWIWFIDGFEFGFIGNNKSRRKFHVYVYGGEKKSECGVDQFEKICYTGYFIQACVQFSQNKNII